MRSILITICCLLLVTGAAIAQSTRGTITGIITDPAGAVIPGTMVEARNITTGAVFQAESSTTGNYTIGELPIGTYEISASMTGFKQFVRSGITVKTAQAVRIDINLEVGEITDTVTVTAAAPILQTESDAVAHNIDGEDMGNLPIVGFYSRGGWIRNPLAVAQLMPGTNFRQLNRFRVNGAPSNTQSERVEGMDSSNQIVPGATVQAQQSVEAIEEYSIQASNYAAEYGQAGSGIINMTMKSGSNTYHGAVYDYWSNEALNAARHWTHIKPINRKHDWGFTLSGPFSIPKVYDATDKLFFFFSYERFQQKNFYNDQFFTFPTDAYRVGDFRTVLTGRKLGVDPLGRDIMEGTIYDPETDRLAPNGQRVRDPFQYQGIINTIDPARFDPIALKIQDLIPRANINALTNNYLKAFENPQRMVIPVVKMDYNLGPATKVGFFFSSTEEYAWQPLGPGAGDGLKTPITTHNPTNTNVRHYRISFDHSLTPTMLLHLGAGYQGMYWPKHPEFMDFDMEKELGLKGVKSPGFTRMTGLTASQGGMRSMGPNEIPLQHIYKPMGNASLTWVKGSHTYKFGGEVRFDSNLTERLNPAYGQLNFSAAQTALAIPGLNLSGGFIGFPYASFLLGLANNGDIGYPSNPRAGKNAWAFFAQDSWKITRKLTLDYGLRWDYQTYLREGQAAGLSFSPTTPNPTAGGLLGAVIFETGDKRFAKVYPHAWGPRLGVAYQFMPKTVIRAGIGITYGQTSPANMITNSWGSTNAFQASAYGDPATTFAQGFPEPGPWPNRDPGQYPRADLGLTNSPPIAIDPNAGRPPRQVQWSLTVQQQLTENLSIEVAYVGNRGAWWEGNRLIDVNAMSAERYASFGLDVNNPADRDIMTTELRNLSPELAARFPAPYAGFPLTKTVAQSLRPFPQFEDINYRMAPLGRTWYDALQMKVIKRFSHGFDVNAGYTWAKELAMGSEGIAGFGENARINDVFNREANKTVSRMSRPHVLYIATNYTTPRFERLGSVLSWIMRDWTYGAILQYSSGMPMSPPSAQNRLSSIMFRGTYANRVPGEPLWTVDINDPSTYDPYTDFVLNPDAWEDPPMGQFGWGPIVYNDYRQKRSPSEAMSIGRIFRLKEGIDLSIRADFNNIFNRTFVSNPTSSNAKATQRTYSNGETRSGFGAINTRSGDPRMGMVVARISF